MSKQSRKYIAEQLELLRRMEERASGKEIIRAQRSISSRSDRERRRAERASVPMPNVPKLASGRAKGSWVWGAK